MKNQKFVLHKALLDAYYTLIVKRNKLEASLEKLDISPNIDACWEYYKEYRQQYKSLEEAFMCLKRTSEAYKHGIKKRLVKGSKEEKAHGLFQIQFCEYGIIHEGIVSICEELGIPYTKVKEKLYRFMQLYHGLEPIQYANPEKADVPIHEFMIGALRQQWFHKAFSMNALSTLTDIVNNNDMNIIDDKYIVHKTIW